MLKRIALIVVLCLVAAPAFAAMPLTIGAGSVGYGATVADRGDLFTSWWAGLRGLDVSPKTGVYVCYQRLGQNGGKGGDGGKLVLVSGSPRINGFYLIADIGVAADLAQDADGTTTAAFTTGGGASLAMTEYINPFIYASAYDAGPRFTWAVHVGLAVTDIQRMIGFDF